eukprot:9991884-Alexandrium_andersonii.AAC.1
MPLAARGMTAYAVRCVGVVRHTRRRQARTFRRDCSMNRGRAFRATSSGVNGPSGADIARVCAAALRGLRFV